MGRDSLTEEYDMLAWRYAADLPMTEEESERLQELHRLHLEMVTGFKEEDFG